LSRVLIGIPTLDGPERLKRALASIREHTDLRDVAIVVSDDGSTPNNLGWAKEIASHFSVYLIAQEQRVGLAKQWNQIVRSVPDAEIVVLINDDIEVVQHWLDVLVFTLDNNSKVGTVGLRSEYGTIAADAPPRPRRDFADSRIVDGNGTLLWSSGPCFAFRRREWESVGGFDERYFVYYEDVDFGITLRQLGFSNVIAEYPVVYHMGGATMTRLDPHTVMAESAKKFAEKWGDKTFAEFRARFAKFNRRTFVEWNSSWKDWP